MTKTGNLRHARGTEQSNRRLRKGAKYEATPQEKAAMKRIYGVEL